MMTTLQSAREARLLFRLCLVNESLDEIRVRRVVREVLRSKRRGAQVLLSRFVRWVKLDCSRHTAKVESATSLPADVRTSVLGALQRAYGHGVRTSFLRNPALIGGMRIRVGTDVYDGSLRGRLDTLDKGFRVASQAQG